MKRKGFTLIEIIIVVVILGILATLALPRITGQLAVGRSAEAMSTLGSIKNAAINCWDAGEDMADCNSQAQLGVTIPVSAQFTYTIVNSGTDELRVIAISKNDGNNCIKMSVDGDTRAVGMTGYGELVNVVNRVTTTRATGAGAGCAAY